MELFVVYCALSNRI